MQIELRHVSETELLDRFAESLGDMAATGDFGLTIACPPYFGARPRLPCCGVDQEECAEPSENRIDQAIPQRNRLNPNSARKTSAITPKAA